ncbi:protein eyes shut-like isoform X3 [Silurus meridionalis]|nr:protein eyes shut-like isoform X3 [Silurus meridionalis]
MLLNCHFFVTSQLLCRRPRYRVWRPQPGNITLRLSLMENTCRNVNHCWNGISERARVHLMDKSYAFPQLCPVEVQLGDTLLAFTDPMLEQYGINLVNVSKEEFDSCFTEQKQKQHLFAGYMNGSLQVASKWLSPGVHYFAATHEGSRHLCHLGLRFSVLVKEQLCQNSPGRHLCSGKGVCRAQTGQFAYGCQCPKPYSEPYCDAVDMCSGGPCQNGANCLSSHAAHQSQASYQCLCPSLFTVSAVVLLNMLSASIPSLAEGVALIQSLAEGVALLLNFIEGITPPTIPAESATPPLIYCSLPLFLLVTSV